MFAPVLQSFAGQLFEPATIAAAFSSTYGSKIHPYAIASIARKLFEAGYLSESGKESRTNSIIYTVAASIAVENTVAENQVDKIFVSFREFANSQALEHSLPLFDNEELDQAFISRLQSFPLPDARAWKASTNNTTGKSTLSLPKFSKLDSDSVQQERKTQWLNAIFSDYVLNNIDPTSNEYDLFLKLASGSIVVEAVLNFCDPKPEKDLKNTWFIVDTPLLMDLLDLDSPQRHIFARDMFEQLKQANGRLGVFSHTVEETSNNIKAALKAYNDRNSHGAIGIRMISDADFVHRIANVSQNLATEIKNLDFTILNTPSSATALGYLSSDLENHLSNNIGSYSNDFARLRDASSIASIVRLRANHKSARQDFSATKYIFITRNSRLAQMSENFLLAQNIYGDDEMPVAVTDSSLAAVLWLTFGSTASTNLPYKRLLANCTAIPQTDQSIRDRVLKLIADDKSELAKSFQIWSRTPRGAEVMLRNSLGDPNLVTTDNLPDFIESVKLAAGSEAASVVRAEMQAELDLTLAAQSEANNLHQLEKAAMRKSLEETAHELNTVKQSFNQKIEESDQQFNELRGHLNKLEDELTASLHSREKNRENIIRSLTQRLPDIQKKWDLIFGSIVGTLAFSFGATGYFFDKYYTVAPHLDPIIMWSMFTLTGVLAFCVYGPIPNLILGGFIRTKKEKFLRDQLRLIGEEALVDAYTIDFDKGTVSKLDFVHLKGAYQEKR